MKKLIYIFLILPAIMISGRGFSQQVIATAGGTASGTGIELSWTIGEPVTATLHGSDFYLTQGFHQSKLVVTAIDPIPLAGFELEVYPNPTSGEVNIKMNKGNISKLRFFLYTSQGEQIRQQEFSSQNEQINMQTLAPGYYMLKIVNDKGSPLQTFKIVKY